MGRPIEKNWRESHPNVELPASNTDIEVTENEWAASLGLPTLDLNDSSLLPPLRNVTIGE